MSLQTDFHIRPLILQRPEEVIGVRPKPPAHQRRRALKEISEEFEGCCAAHSGGNMRQLFSWVTG
ncbi:MULTISPECIES: hypothetical protein [Pseudomonas]|uniref:hypothetical protein n=1 Tax=Pseudomonas TaxID=286 RepID=UPI001071172A|nr:MULTISPECIES: hypothetical protein [Pseudomonas]QBR31387.1 hypothetical protein E3Z29_12890 [Pseudomonas sp. S150]UZT94902.1 hypothetical protein OPS05_10105 [Pseudomonas koreensis]